MDVSEVIETRWRWERNLALAGCALICGLQIAAITVWWLMDGWSYFAHTRPILTIAGLMMFPFGWGVIVVGIPYWFRGRALKRDLAPGNLLTVHGRIEKWPLNCDFDDKSPEPYQFVRIPGQVKRLTVPLAFWQTLRDAQEVDCQYLKGSKLVYRINGEYPWKPSQQGQSD